MNPLENIKYEQIRTNTNKIVPISSKIYQCECEKTFKHASSLWNHKQKCIYIEAEEEKCEESLLLRCQYEHILAF